MSEQRTVVEISVGLERESFIYSIYLFIYFFFEWFYISKHPKVNNMCATPQIVFLTQFFPFCLLCLIRRLQDCVLTWDSPKPRYDLMKTMNYCKAQKGPTSESQHLLVNREDSLSSHNAFLPFICSLCKLSGVT